MIFGEFDSHRGCQDLAEVGESLRDRSLEFAEAFTSALAIATTGLVVEYVWFLVSIYVITGAQIMAIDLDTTLPSIRFFQEYVKNKTRLELKTTLGEQMTGCLIWQDPIYFCLQDDNKQQYFINREFVVYIKPLESSNPESSEE
ncbi:Hfq-related RNA-binding protein [Baaleninema sp.]|uniref:Hfq-related RNA-binding protein n=1 Tax=Baaleninema sp. TaxID=3101197 RepID=UPI003D05D8E4